jgi:hypothetical protein
MQPKPMRSAPKDGTIILIRQRFHRDFVAAYWHRCSMVTQWRALADGWVNESVEWLPLPPA